MAQPARARESASNQNVVGVKQIAEFWSAVQDCLVQIHHLPRPEAAEKVTGLLRRLSNLTVPAEENGGSEGQRSFDEMIYHEEPWYIACNLAENEIPLDKEHRPAYDQILRQNHLA
jgi:hypothetical protein